MYCIEYSMFHREAGEISIRFTFFFFAYKNLYFRDDIFEKTIDISFSISLIKTFAMSLKNILLSFVYGYIRHRVRVVEAISLYFFFFFEEGRITLIHKSLSASTINRILLD